MPATLRWKNGRGREDSHHTILKSAVCINSLFLPTSFFFTSGKRDAIATSTVEDCADRKRTKFNLRIISSFFFFKTTNICVLVHYVSMVIVSRENIFRDPTGIFRRGPGGTQLNSSAVVF